MFDLFLFFILDWRQDILTFALWVLLKSEFEQQWSPKQTLLNDVKCDGSDLLKATHFKIQDFGLDTQL